MSARASQERKATAPELFIATAHRNAVAPVKSVRGSTIHPSDNRPDCTPEAAVDDVTDLSWLPAMLDDATNLMRVLRQLGFLTKLQAARIAFKSKGNILFLTLADIAAVQAEGNYVSLRHRARPYLVHESLSSMADKLKPYGFIRIHRSVVVNTSAVEEIQPLPTGEYRLRVKGGKEYLVTRTYKHSLRDLAQLWVGSELLRGGSREFPSLA